MKCALALISLFAGSPALAAYASPSHTLGGSPTYRVPELLLPAVDTQALLDQDEILDPQALPARFAAPIPTDISPDTHGRWETLPNGDRLWRLHLVSPDALSLNLFFRHYELPDGAELHLYNPETGFAQGPYGAADNNSHGELWTPVVLGDRLMVELLVPAKAAFEPELLIARAHHGYRYFGTLETPAGPSPDQGSCNIDVICPEGDDWRTEIRSEAVYQLSGYWTCSGQMLNMVSREFKPYFLTANHCGISSGNAQSLVVYWNYESPSCGRLSGGSLNQNQRGASLRASRSFSDFCLVELDETPDAEWNVSYSGWDASDAVAQSCVAIHHPGTDEKAISFNTDRLISDAYLGNGNDGSHWQVNNWERGTTEPGSSGSGIWSPDHHLVGQLHGGYASCSSITADWYGKFSESWDRGTSASSRLKDWLDPDDTGIEVVDTSDPTPPAPILRFANSEFVDDCDGTSNGVLEPGETVTVDAEFEAFYGTIEGIQGRLRSLTPGVSMVDSIATWPDLAAGERSGPDSPFVIRLSSSVKCGTDLEFAVHVQYDGGTVSTSLDAPVGALGASSGTFVKRANIRIPDNNSAGVGSVLKVTGQASLLSLLVGVDISHTYVGDLAVSLTSPAGKTVQLLDRPGHPGDSCNNNDMLVAFDDEATTDLENHCAGSNPWFRGFGLPAQSLAEFRGAPINGDWTLTVQDRASQDSGTLNRWGIRFFDSDSAICDPCESLAQTGR